MLSLQRIKESDLDNLREWRNNPAIYDWCRQSTLISTIGQSHWYIKQAEDPYTEMYMITDQVGKGLGVCGLTSIDHLSRRAEFSLYVRPDSWGRGYGKEALKLLLRVGFLDLNLNIIWGESFNGNPAIKMFEKIGFIKEGTRRQFYYKNGEYVDAHLFSMTREEFDGFN